MMERHKYLFGKKTTLHEREVLNKFFTGKCFDCLISGGKLRNYVKHIHEIDKRAR